MPKFPQSRTLASSQRTPTNIATVLTVTKDICIIIAMKKSYITMKSGKLEVPYNPTIPYIEGDGIGAEVTQVALEVINAAVAKAYNNQRAIEWTEIYAGGKAVDKFGPGCWLPQETVEAIQQALVAIKGPLMTPVGKGMRSINVQLRQTLDLYVCLRPVRYFTGVPSPVKHPEQVDMVVFRENTEDIYAGIEWGAETQEAHRVISFLQGEMGVSSIRFPQTSAIGVKPVSEEGSKRLIRSAIEYAIQEKRNTLTLVHKGNIMKFTEGGFRQWGYELAKEEFGGVQQSNGTVAIDAPHGTITVNDVIADAFLQNILLKPHAYDVVATLNLNGDYISDALAAMVGGIGIAPGANINFQSGAAVFEATHGTAPDIAGTGKANPGSLILSGEMMLRYMGWGKAADCIVGALESCYQQGIVTHDLAALQKTAGLHCHEFGNKLIEHIQTGDMV